MGPPEAVSGLAALLLAPERLSAAGIGPSEERFLEAVSRVHATEPAPKKEKRGKKDKKGRKSSLTTPGILRPRDPEPPEGAVSLTTGTYEELRELGMSVTQAKRVIRYREERGGFTSIAPTRWSA